MKKTISASILILMLSNTAHAQQETTLDKLFNLLEQFSEETQPMVEGLLTEMAPKLEQLQSLLTDWSLYEAPEVLPNGDIIIRRKNAKPDQTDDKPFQKAPRDI